METVDLLSAMLEKVPFIYNGIIYSRISAVIFREKNNEVTIQVELEDKNKNSVTIASAARVNRLGDAYEPEDAEKKGV